MQKVNDPAVRHTSSGALIRRFLPYLAKYKKTLFIDLFCAAMTTLCDIILPKIMSTITNSAMGVGITLTAGIADKTLFALADNGCDGCGDDTFVQQDSGQVGQIFRKNCILQSNAGS